MRFQAVLALALLAAALLLLVAFSHFGNIADANAGGSVSANVSVVCPIYRNMSVSTFYVTSSNIIFNYSLATAVNCGVIRSMNGTLDIWSAKSTPLNPVFSNTLEAENISMSKKTFEISLGRNLSIGSYYVNISFNSKYYRQQNNSPAEFLVATPANILITSASSTPSVSIGSPVTFYTSMENAGNLSSTSNTVLHMEIAGPGGFANETNYTIGAIGANSNVSRSVTLYTVSPNIGTYNVSEYVTYYSSYSLGHKTYASGEQTSPKYAFSYAVVKRPSSSPPPPKPVPPPPASINNVVYTSTPVLVTTFSGKSAVSPLSVYNRNSVPIWVNFTDPAIPAGISVSTSAGSLYLPPNQGASVSVLLNVSSSLQPGSYIAGLPETITPVNGTPTSYTQYITVVVESPNTSKPSLLNTITALNNSKNVQGEVEVLNPTSTNIYNTTASISIPGIVARNTSDISIAGAAGNVSFSSGVYNIEWYLPVLPAGATSTLYYTVKNATDLAAFESSPISFTVPSQVPISTIKLFNINIPTFYANVSGMLSVGALYSGTRPNNITFSVLGPPSMTVINNTQSFSVLPNTVLLPRFKIFAPASGTYVVTLFVSGAGISDNYTFDLVVLPRPVVTTTVAVTTTIPQKPAELKGYMPYSIGIAAAIAILVALIEMHKKRYRARYNPERAAKLRELKEHIRRVE